MFFSHCSLHWYLYSRIRFICPSRQLDEKKTACNWTNESGPVYYATANTFNFTMFMSNALAPNDPPIQQYLGVVDNYAIGK